MPSQTSSPLSQSINTVTRPIHTKLNTLILSLLPHALPPHVSDPELYASGVSHILPIYEAFEGPLRQLLQRTYDSNEEGRTVQALKKIYIPQLERASRLRQDIEKLQRRLRLGNTSQHIEHECPKLDSFTKYIARSIITSPHLLLSYTWILYMALFSGGRHIRTQLRQAGPAFWSRQPTHEEPYDSRQGDVDEVMNYWTFDGDQDGEDIKADFKRRFADIAACLTEKEQEDVIQEAVFVMESMLEVVTEVADAVSMQRTAAIKSPYDSSSKATPAPQANDDDPSIRVLLLKHILPMGMMELLSGAASAITRGLGTSCPDLFTQDTSEKRRQ